MGKNCGLMHSLARTPEFLRTRLTADVRLQRRPCGVNGGQGRRRARPVDSSQQGHGKRGGKRSGGADIHKRRRVTDEIDPHVAAWFRQIPDNDKTLSEASYAS